MSHYWESQGTVTEVLQGPACCSEVTHFVSRGTEFNLWPQKSDET